MSDKSQTYSVEAENAELRHYLARLARKSRCFSRCIHALARAVKPFVFAWNRRQLFKRALPAYPAHVSVISLSWMQVRPCRQCRPSVRQLTWTRHKPP